MASKGLYDKDDQPIEILDKVSVNTHQGVRMGIVVDLVKTEEEAREKGVQNPPKVILEDQEGVLTLLRFGRRRKLMRVRSSNCT